MGDPAASTAWSNHAIPLQWIRPSSMFLLWAASTRRRTFFTIFHLHWEHTGLVFSGLNRITSAKPSNGERNAGAKDAKQTQNEQHDGGKEQSYSEELRTLQNAEDQSTLIY